MLIFAVFACAPPEAESTPAASTTPTTIGPNPSTTDPTDPSTTDPSTTDPSTTSTSTGTSTTDPSTTTPPAPVVDLRDGELDLMPLGDSITLGVSGGYRNGVYEALTAAGYAVDLVGTQSDPYTQVPDHDHEGHSGYSTWNVLDELDGWLAAGDPDVVLLMIGTNDVAWWIAEDVTDVADRLDQIVDRILASRAGVTVVVATIPPESSQLVAPDYVDRALLAAEYDAEVRLRVAAHPDHVYLADVEPALTVDDLYDGIHPDEDAHDVIAQVWVDALTPLLP
ncbi:MAG: GDSL-type esterase/lipase family protein [Myxococcota bacterium]